MLQNNFLEVNMATEARKLKLQITRTEAADILEIDFIEGINAENDELIKFVVTAIRQMAINMDMGGELLKITGRCSVPLAMCIGGLTKPYYKSVAVYDPKIKKFVVTMTNGGLDFGTRLD